MSLGDESEVGRAVETLRGWRDGWGGGGGGGGGVRVKMVGLRTFERSGDAGESGSGTAAGAGSLFENCRVLWVEPRDVDDSTSTSTLTTPSSALYTLSTSLHTHFLTHNLLSISPRQQPQPLTLHLTVLNAIYAQDRRRKYGSRGGGRERSGYDVRALVDEFKDVIWCDEVMFDKVELMRMGEVKGEVGTEREGESWYVSLGAVEL